MAQEFEIERIPVIVSFDESALYTETYGFAGTSGTVFLEGQRLVPRGKPAEVVILFMHPSSTLQLMPLPAALARAGIHVLCAGSRYAKNDTAAIMEKVAIDLGAYVRHAKQELGYKTVILGGWSGGGSLALFYQSEAENPTITATPAGDPVDLTKADLMPADAVTLLAAHVSRAVTLTEWMDPSVKDEFNPDDREVELDLYDPANPNQPPFAPDYLARFRGCQIARNRKITAWVFEMLETLEKRGTAELERAFVVHRTMADPRWLDITLEPNDRKANWCYLGNPETVNGGRVGIARFNTLRSWLSQWSFDESRANGEACAKLISAPTIVIENSADDAAPSSHATRLFGAVASADKEHHSIQGATHYYRNQPEQLAQAVTTIAGWMRDRGYCDG